MAVKGCSLNLHVCGRAAAGVTPRVVVDPLGERLGSIEEPVGFGTVRQHGVAAIDRQPWTRRL